MNNDDIKNFYDDLSSYYNIMTDFNNRFIREAENFSRIIENYKLKKVLDAGCGTGFHSILLAKLGCSVTAIDISENNLNIAQDNAKKYNVNIKTIQSDFIELSKNLKQQFDGIFCLGNSIPHLLTYEKIVSVFKNFYDLLNENGILFLQLLNYEKILSDKKTIINKKKIGSITFTRSYNYIGSLIEFSINIIEHQRELFNKKVMLLPIKKELIEKGLIDAGFNRNEIYGSIKLDIFFPMESNDLIVISNK